MKHDDPELIIDKVGKDLVVGTPLAQGRNRIRVASQ
jgi:hypothetical protein